MGFGVNLGPVVNLLAVAVEVVHRVVSTIIATGDIVAVAAHLQIAHVLQLVGALARHLKALQRPSCRVSLKLGLLYHSTLVSRVIKKKRQSRGSERERARERERERERESVRETGTCVARVLPDAEVI